MMIIIIETIILCLIFTFFVYIMSKDPIKTLYNYPPKVIEKVKANGKMLKHRPLAYRLYHILIFITRAKQKFTSKILPEFRWTQENLRGSVAGGFLQDGKARAL